MLQKKFHIGYCTAPFTFQKAKEKMRKLNKWGNECWNECWNDGLTWKECLWFASIQLYLIPTQANRILHLTEWLPGEWDAKEQVRNDVQRKPYKKRTVSHAGCLPTCIKTRVYSLIQPSNNGPWADDLNFSLKGTNPDDAYTWRSRESIALFAVSFGCTWKFNQSPQASCCT